MKRAIGLAILVAAAGGGTLLAQGKGDAPREGRRGERGREIAEFLDLTQDQRAQWREIATEHRERLKPMLEEGRALRENARKLMDSGASDAEVGAAMRAAREHREKVRAANQEMEGRLVSVLTEEQKTKYEAFKAARRTGRDGRRERGPWGQGPPEADAGPEDEIDEDAAPES